MTRGGQTKEREAPERRCIATGARGETDGLIRFVVGPDNQIVPDLAEKLPGRGIWVSADRAALDKAVAKGLFSRGAKQAVTVDPGLVDLVEDRLVARVVDLISLARRAGLARAGMEKVKSVLVDDSAVCLLQASDGSDREKGRLRPPNGENSYFADLTAAELGLAFGRDRVIHAALISGGLSERVRYDCARLMGLRKI